METLNEKDLEMAQETLDAFYDAALDETVRECELFCERHKGASNEVLAQLVWEVFSDDADNQDIPECVALARFCDAFPILSWYL